MSGTRIFVKGLTFMHTDESLKDAFKKFGSIKECNVVLDEHKQGRGYGFVTYDKAESAVRAIQQMNGKKLDDKKLTVNVAKMSGNKKPAFKNGGGKKPEGSRIKPPQDVADKGKKRVRPDEEQSHGGKSKKARRHDQSDKPKKQRRPHLLSLPNELRAKIFAELWDVEDLSFTCKKLRKEVLPRVFHKAIVRPVISGNKDGIDPQRNAERVAFFKADRNQPALFTHLCKLTMVSASTSQSWQDVDPRTPELTSDILCGLLDLLAISNVSTLALRLSYSSERKTVNQYIKDTQLTFPSVVRLEVIESESAFFAKYLENMTTFTAAHIYCDGGYLGLGSKAAKQIMSTLRLGSVSKLKHLRLQLSEQPDKEKDWEIDLMMEMAKTHWASQLESLVFGRRESMRIGKVEPLREAAGLLVAFASLRNFGFNAGARWDSSTGGSISEDGLALSVARMMTARCPTLEVIGMASLIGWEKDPGESWRILRGDEGEVEGVKKIVERHDYGIERGLYFAGDGIDG